jgi:hypothetical protein
MRALAILFLVPGFSLGLVAGVTHLVGPIDTVSQQQTSLVWSNRVFPTQRDFAAWLVSRGSTYELWSQRHPAAAQHFDDPARQSLVASSAVQPSGRHVRATTELLVATISFAALLAMLALTRFVRSARFLLEPPRIGLRLRGPSLAVPFDWRTGWITRYRFGRITPGRATQLTRPNSRLVRHYLPKVTFYAMAVVFSFAIGAWIAVYLQ